MLSRSPFALAAARTSLFALCLVGCVVLPGCKKRSQVVVEQGTHPSKEAQWTYYCAETKQWIQAPPEGPPATNPQTGRKTLGLALYCAECRKWIPVPPPPVHMGNPLGYHCPEHKVRMAVTGPAP
ncbi:MAG: hypothetical protein U0903_02100 [Planctomycetales bacterium]